MSTVDTRVHGKLTKKLNRLAQAVLKIEDLIDPATVRLEKKNGPFEMPDCKNCEDRCCVHKEPGSGILLSLQDVANLVDSGLGDLIVGQYTFKKKRDEVLFEIDKMPRLKKNKGNCIFYDEKSGLCTEYGLRPGICRRFPYEVEYKKTRSREEPIVRFVPKAPCPKISSSEDEDGVRQVVVDAVDDENISFEDTMLLPYHHKELRKIGFGPYLPSPEDCPA